MQREAPLALAPREVDERAVRTREAEGRLVAEGRVEADDCLLYTSPSPRDS